MTDEDLQPYDLGTYKSRRYFLGRRAEPNEQAPEEFAVVVYYRDAKTKENVEVARVDTAQDTRISTGSIAGTKRKIRSTGRTGKQSKNSSRTGGGTPNSTTKPTVLHNPASEQLLVPLGQISIGARGVLRKRLLGVDGRLIQGSHLRGDPADERLRGHLVPLGEDGTGREDAPLADDDLRTDRRVEPDQRALPDGRVVEDGAVTDHHPLAHGRGVNDGVVPDVRFGADPDRPHVPAQHDPRPDAGVRTDRHVADHHRVLAHPRAVGDLGRFPLEGVLPAVAHAV